MYDRIFVMPWPWWVAGPSIGLVVVLLAWVTGKALGVSTGYGSLCALGSRLPFFEATEYLYGWIRSRSARLGTPARGAAVRA